jgi:hypothetical protein
VIVARRLGEGGYVPFLKELHRLGVLQHAELLTWLELHGRVLRMVEPPLDGGDGVSYLRVDELRLRELNG